MPQRSATRPRFRPRLPALVCAAVLGSFGAATTVAGERPTNLEVPTPQRILDTRSGTGAPVGPVEPGSVLRLDVPATRGSGAAVFNLTATDAVGAGHVSVWPCDTDPPDTSVLNIVPGRAVPNTVVVGRSPSGICLETSVRMHLVADLMAVADGASLSPVTPKRLLDTRSARDPFGAGEVRRLGIPDAARSLDAVNVTVVEPTADGFVTAAPCGSFAGRSPGASPTTSTVNFRRGETVAATTFVNAASGEICLYASTPTHVLVDHFAGADGNRLTPSTTPRRALDTRSRVEGAPHATTLPVRLAGRAGVPNDAAAAIVTATVIADGDGHVTVWPCDAPQPETSLLNTWPGAVRANTAIVGLSRDGGEVCLRPWTTDGSPVELLVDVVGWVDGDVDRDPPPADGGSGGGGQAPSDPTPITPTGDPSATGRFPTLPPGSTLPSGAQCATRIRPTPEVRPANAVPNSTRGTAPNGRYPRVDGDFTGTTDEIMQWVSCKWGIDTDVVRAQIVKESWWNQSNVGDGGESFGLGQVRVPYHQEAFAFDDAIRSSAYNLDYTYAGWRSCYEGNETWLNDVERGAWYEAGDLWGCLGVWFTGRWYVPDVYVYLDGGPTDGYGDLGVREHLARRTWEHPDFLNG